MDASFRGAGYALMLEGSPEQKIQSERRLLCVWRSGEKISPPHNWKCRSTWKNLRSLHGIFWICTHFVGSNNTNNCPERQNLVVRFFKTKPIPPFLWTTCNSVLQFVFKRAFICGSVDTTPGFLYRLELKVKDKIRLKIREDVQTIPIEGTTSSLDVADEEQLFFTQTDGEEQPEEQIPERKINPGKKKEIGQQMRNHPQWNQVLKKLQKSTETIRRIPLKESRKMHEQKKNRSSI